MCDTCQTGVTKKASDPLDSQRCICGHWTPDPPNVRQYCSKCGHNMDWEKPYRGRIDNTQEIIYTKKS
jgi:hypothetical protein